MIDERQKPWRKSEKEIAENWELIFGKKDKKKDEEKERDETKRTSR